jgi:NhaA family Na+:H+ antiporter
VFAYIAVRSGISSLPRGVNWLQIVAVAMLAGIGFTVALFITGLAYEGDSLEVFDTQARMGILLASFIASILGLWMLSRATQQEPEDQPDPLQETERQKTQMSQVPSEVK